MKNPFSTAIIGGTFSKNPEEVSSSKVVYLLGQELEASWIVNGDQIKEERINNYDISDFDLTIWMPNILGDIEKNYPEKRKGSILICSKRRRKDGNRLDSISRIFEMHGNAVIEIDKCKDMSIYNFTLIDALGNEWIDTTSISELALTIRNFCNWTKGSIRFSSSPLPGRTENMGSTPESEKFLELNRFLAQKVEQNLNSRFFGNCSTRCTALFPSMRKYEGFFLVSKRNINKQYITIDDMVFVKKDPWENTILYKLPGKPSVDTPIQLKIYNKAPSINYMIHGHAFVKNPDYTTTEYFPCGDLREFNELWKWICCNQARTDVINLKNHGFLVYSNNLESLENKINSMRFENNA